MEVNQASHVAPKTSTSAEMLGGAKDENTNIYEDHIAESEDIATRSAKSFCPSHNILQVDDESTRTVKREGSSAQKHEAFVHEGGENQEALEKLVEGSEAQSVAFSILSQIGTEHQGRDYPTSQSAAANWQKNGSSTLPQSQATSLLPFPIDDGLQLSEDVPNDKTTNHLHDASIAAHSFKQPTGFVHVVDTPIKTTPPLSLLNGDTMATKGPYLESSPSIREADAPRIQAFAKLEFDDGQFYMNTYAVELGRDVRAARQAFKNEVMPERQNGEIRRSSSSGGNLSHTPSRVKQDESTRLGGSVMSESGGIMGLGSQRADDPRRKKRSRRGDKKSKSTSSSSQRMLHGDSAMYSGAQTNYQALAMSSIQNLTAGAHPVDPRSLLPSPDECPIIPIHPPTEASGSGAGHKGISRKHVRIAYNFDKRLFEVKVLGKNGAFVDDHWHAPGEVRPLKSGSFIQIGGVGVRFVLPDVALGETGAEGSHTGAGEEGMSFTFENEQGESIEMEDSENPMEDEDDEDDEVETDEEGELAHDGVATTSSPVEENGEEDEEEEEEEEPPQPPPPPIKRGPGRPPKNGIMSKRQQREQEKLLKAKAQKTIAAPQATKGKVGRPRKVPALEISAVKPEKRKYTKRKTADPQIEQTRTNGEIAGQHFEVKPPKEKKPPKPPKPPRSPSPVFDESTLTPEQLQKPQSSYVVLIYEALSNSPSGAMTLPQIYRAIERRYPFYKLRVQTTGWQSSVRHNLSQHLAFQKIQRDGKGWLWGIVEGVSIEKERRKRASPPLPPPQHHLQYPPMSQGFHPHPQIVSAGPNISSASTGLLQQDVAPGAGLPSDWHQRPSQETYHHAHDNPPPPAPASVNVALAHSRPHQSTSSRPPQPRQSSNPRGPAAQPNDVLTAISDFKNALTKSMPNNPRAEILVQSAINRVLGISKKSTYTPEGQPEDPQEEIFMKALSGMLRNVRETRNARQNQGARQSPAAQAPPPPPPQPSALTQAKSNNAAPSNQNAPAQLLLLLQGIQRRGPPATSARPTSTNQVKVNGTSLPNGESPTSAAAPATSVAAPSTTLEQAQASSEARTNGASALLDSPATSVAGTKRVRETAAVEMEKDTAIVGPEPKRTRSMTEAART